MAAKKYTVLVGYNAPPNETRAEPGDVVYLTDDEAQVLVDEGVVEHISVTQEREAAAEKAAAEAEKGGK